MTEKEFKNLKPGDVIQSPSDQIPYVVTIVKGNRIMAAKAIHERDNKQWEVICKKIKQK